LLWLTLAATVAFIALAIDGAFMGGDKANPDKAKDFFNTPPLVGFWCALVAMLVISIFATPNIFRRPASLLMHAGGIVFLIGSMWSSAGGHELAQKVFGNTRILSGFMALHKGERTDAVSDGHGASAGNLPFAVELLDYRVDHYPPKDKHWQLMLEWPTRALDSAGGESIGWPDEPVAWKLGEEVALPHTNAHATVLEYLDNAGPLLAVMPPGLGDELAIPVKVGAEFDLDNPKLHGKITKIFTHIRVAGVEGAPEIVDDNAQENPGIQAQFRLADGTKRTAWILPPNPMHVLTIEGARFFYYPGPTGENPGQELPAMRLSVRQGDKARKLWLIAEPGRDYATFELNDVLGLPKATPMDERRVLILAPQTPIMAYKSDVQILSRTKPIERAVIEVNHPLHHGDYHFFQRSEGVDEQGVYTVLYVKSDAGLMAVWVGLGMICLGAFWHFWFIPAGAFLRKGIAPNGH
jgi:hypothetical protein